ncbi:MAG TPA: acyltransferase family protein [Terracidiphilus sp.]|jgi:peptidoglycan/LPS O-acetylase OafA/YrhL|nr:acyltransferase family protein [Terracidiphilus sp.]
MSQIHPDLTHPKYRPDIDGLRAVAVLSVVAFHAFPNWIQGGFIGVDVFFVISGFLISTIIFENLDRGSFSFLEFYARRIRRIFPTLLLVLTACAAFGWFALLAEEYKQLGKHIAAGAGFVSNFALWKEAGYFDNSADTKPLLHLWSLGIEEQFYIIWPLLLWFAWKRKRILPVVILVIAIVSFYLNISGIKQDATAAYYAPQTRFWELLSGSLLAWLTTCQTAKYSSIRAKVDGWLASLFRKGKEADGKTLANVLSILGLSLLAYGFWRIDKYVGFPGKWALVPVLGAVFVIAAGSGGWLNRILLSNKIAVWFGLISFPLYLWHWPLLSFARIVQSEAPSRKLRVAAVVLAICLAWLTQKLVEQHLRRGGNGRLKVAFLVAAMMLVGSLGYVDFRQEGLPARFPQEVRSVFDTPDFSHASFPMERNCTRYSGGKFLSVCTENQAPILFVMGDSHAGAFFSGLNDLQRDYVFGLDTAIGCGNAPYLVPGDYGDGAWCDSSQARNGFNLFALEKISEIKPAIVILHARWAYDLYNTDQPSMVRKLRETIRRISKASPASKIMVVGPVPNWKTSPQRELYLSWRRSHVGLTGQPLPTRLKDGLVPEIKEWDEAMSRAVPKMGATYISAYKTLCNADGCLARVGSTANEVTATDYGHLSPAGSIYLTRQLKSAVFSLLPAEPQARHTEAE